MPRKAVPPTRGNYLRVQRSLARTRVGHDMLERKRQILVLEMMGKVEAARMTRDEVRTATAGAYQALQRAALAAGAERLVRESCGIQAEHTLSIRSHSIMGVEVPEVSFRADEMRLPFGFTLGASGADEVLKSFRAALEPILRLAEVENAVLRLAREVKRTQRRVNALETIFIPTYEDTIKFIRESLEEREREELLAMKNVKRMRQPEPGSPTGGGAAEGQDA